MDKPAEITKDDLDIADLDDVGAGTDFSEPIQYTPLEKTFVQNLEEKVFSLMRGKKKIVAPVKTVGTQEPMQEPIQTQPQIELQFPDKRSDSLVAFGPFKKKTFIDKARDQLRFPAINKVNAVINSLAMIAFAGGAYLIYAALPTRPDIVIGIVVVAAASNVLVSSR